MIPEEHPSEIIEGRRTAEDDETTGETGDPRHRVWWAGYRSEARSLRRLFPSLGDREALALILLDDARNSLERIADALTNARRNDDGEDWKS